MITNLPKTASLDQKINLKSLATKELLATLGSCEEGLSASEAQNRLLIYGYNEIAREKKCLSWRD
jgi:magnesium-transporting ATPase (P-type)